MMICLAITCSWVTNAETVEPNREIIISYVVHPHVEDIYLPLVRTVYENLGFTVEFLPISIKRGLVSLDEGLVDADVARFMSGITIYKGISAIKPTLGQGIVHLLCNKNQQVACDSRIMDDKDITILAMSNLVSQFKREFATTILATIYPLDNMGVYLDMLRSERVDFAFYPSASIDLPADISARYNSIVVSTHQIVHVINNHSLGQYEQLISNELEKQLLLRNKKGD